MGKIAATYNRFMVAIGLRPIKNAIVPGTESYQVLKEWIESPLKASGSLDWDMRNKIYSLRRTARGLALNNPLVRQYLQLLEQNVIGHNGIRLQSQVRDKTGVLDKNINNIIETGWKDFWRDPWVDGRMSGVAGEQLLMRTIAVDGEVFVRRIRNAKYRYGMKLQMIDADLVDHQYNRVRGANGENEIRLGIEVDEWGKAAAMWVWSSTPWDINSSIPRDRKRIPAEEMVHLYDPDRINQTRGITWLNSVITPLSILDGYVEASLVAARTGACSMPMFKHTDASLYDTNQASGGKAPSFNIQLNPGGGLTLPPGLEMQEFDPSKPTTNFGEFTKANTRWVSSGLCTSYNALANDLEGVNFSSMRSGLLIERDSWKCIQQMHIDRFRWPVFEWFLSDAILAGGLTLPTRDARNYLAAKWVPRGWPWVDPLKDVNSAVIAIQNGLGCRTDYLAEKGEDFEETCEKLTDEKQISTAAGLDFSAVASSGTAAAALPADDGDLTPEEIATDKKRTQALFLAHRRGA